MMSINDEATWKEMTFDDFNEKVIHPFTQMNEDDFVKAITELPWKQANFLLKKLWTVQDELSYEDSLVYFDLIQAILLIRLDSETGFPNLSEQKKGIRQLAHVNILLQPQLVDGVAEAISHG